MAKQYSEITKWAAANMPGYAKPMTKTAAGLQQVLRLIAKLNKKGLPVPANLIKRRDVNLISGAQRLPRNNDLKAVTEAHNQMSARNPLSKVPHGQIEQTINSVSNVASKHPSWFQSWQESRMQGIQQTLRNIGDDFASIRKQLVPVKGSNFAYDVAVPYAKNLLKHEQSQGLIPKGINVLTPLFPTTKSPGWYNRVLRTVNFPLLK